MEMVMVMVMVMGGQHGKARKILQRSNVLASRRDVTERLLTSAIAASSCLGCTFRFNFVAIMHAKVQCLVPNMPLKVLPGDSQETNSATSTSLCSHQRHLFASEQLHNPHSQPFKDATVAISATNDVFTTLMTTAVVTSTTSTTTTAAAAAATTTIPTTSTIIELPNQDVHCHKYGKHNNSNNSNQVVNRSSYPGVVQSLPLSTAAVVQKTSQATGDKRPAPAPVPVAASTSASAPSAASSVASVEHVIKLNASSPVPAPNFKDDPAGYLQQQTTLLHNTLNVGLEAKPVAATVRSLPLESQQQQQQRHRIRRLSLFAGGKWELEPNSSATTSSSGVSSPRSLHVDTAVAFVRPQNPQITSITMLPAAQESPVSSSGPAEPEKRPEQVGAISTSHESPRHSLSSPTDSLDSAKSTPSPSPKPAQLQLQIQAQSSPQLRLLRQQCQPIGRQPTLAYNGNGGTTLTRSIVTTTAGISRPGTTLSSASSTVAQLQSMANPGGGNQLIMTSSGQLLVIPTTSKPQASPSQPQRSTPGAGAASYIVSQPSALINTSGAKLLHHHHHHHQHQIISSQASQISQISQISQAGAQTVAPPQTVLLNTLPNGGYIVHHQQQQPQQHHTTTTAEQQQQLLAMPQPQPQPQPQGATLMSSPEGKRRARKRKSSVCSTPPPMATTTKYGGASGSPGKTHSPQISPSIPSQAPALLQQAAVAAAAAAAAAAPPPPPPQFSQQFQLSPGIQGIVVNKPTATAAPQHQQLLLQNGQILQQVNLIGQQLLMPTGLVMGTTDATLLQIQNMPTTSLLTPQGPVMLRTPSPQNKPSFISPSAGGQQYIVGANGQLSPIGQIYSTPMGLVMPTAQQGGASFVQASPTATIQIQQSHPHPHPQQQAEQLGLATTYVSESRQATAASPPDTTTCSPSSPERPPSHRSSGSGDMVQCVSSSEPDAAISPQSVESRLSPSSTDCERSIGSSNVFSQPSNMYKPTEAKIRRIHITSHSQASSSEGNNHHGVALVGQESPTTTQLSPAVLDAAPPSLSEVIPPPPKTPTKRARRPHRTLLRCSPTTSGQNGRQQLALLPPRTFAIGELIWGPARGHPAWPGKIVKMPDGVCTPSQQFDHVWVQWFGSGGRSSSELIPVNSLQSLSEGLDAHHKAQKDTRKSRKLNSQLERAIQEAMTELDNISASSASTAATVGHQLQQQQQQQPTSTNNNSHINSNGLARGKRSAATTGQAIANCGSMTLTASTATAMTLTGLFNQQQQQQRAKPIRIAPAPPTTTTTTTATSEILKLAK
ncbi:hypothetical protein ACLKA6_002652 [Drosophila palustris]